MAKTKKTETPQKISEPQVSEPQAKGPADATPAMKTDKPNPKAFGRVRTEIGNGVSIVRNGVRK